MRELSHLEQLETLSDPAALAEGVAARDRVPRARPERHRSGASRRHRMASRSTTFPRLRSTTASIVLDGTRAAAREALVHEPRLRARAGRVRDLRAAGPLRSGARTRRLGDEPAACAAAARKCSSPPAGSVRPGPTGGTARLAFPLPHAGARDHGPVRGAAPAGTCPPARLVVVSWTSPSRAGAVRSRVLRSVPFPAIRRSNK